jgi:glyceraldehyde 3-phosphate dehydrogenase
MSARVGINGFGRIYAWHDNEWGYVNRLIDLARKVAETL